MGHYLWSRPRDKPFFHPRGKQKAFLAIVGRTKGSPGHPVQRQGRSPCQARLTLVPGSSSAGKPLLSVSPAGFVLRGERGEDGRAPGAVPLRSPPQGLAPRPGRKTGALRQDGQTE